MQVPLQIELRHIDASAALEAAIRKHADKLERFSGDIRRCQVAIEMTGTRRAHGRHYAVHLDLKVRGDEIVSTRHQDEDVYVAVRDAFEAVQRRLEDYVRERRGQVKRHAE